MPVVRTINDDTRPTGCTATSAGTFSVPTDGGRFDCHFHDYAEYWLVVAGKAKVVSEGEDYYVRSGDIVCTAAGDEHDVIEVYEDLTAFYLEEAGPPDARKGHLHRDAEKARGHDVPALPLPAGFPGVAHHTS
jgi:mannose-6-phosphate isomerase-like protein (cupin superfamily)